MATRREFLHAGLAASAFSLTAAGRIASAVPQHDPAAGQSLGRLSLDRVIFDHRYRESVAFAAEAGALGYRTHGIRGDITDLWYAHLSVGWKTAPASIAGLTDEPALFCLERLSWDYGLRVIYHVVHTRPSDGALASPASWPRESARTLANPSPDALRMGSGAPFVMGATAVSDGDLEPLVSWIIAQRERAQEIRLASL